LDSLVAYRSSLVTTDTAEALRALERAGSDVGAVRFQNKGVPSAQCSWAGVTEDAGPTGLPPHLSLRPSGREVYLRVSLLDYQGNEESRRQAELALLWSLAVPLGFVPWSRYPVPGATDEVFHFLGPWAPLGDFLQGEGRGEEAWPSICSAAQCQVQKWEGPRLTERSVQTHLHRLGIHCGPVDGLMGERTLSSIRALGLGGLELQEVLIQLQKLSGHAPKKKEGERQIAHFSTDGPLPEAFSSGLVHTIKTKTGYAVAADGPGRLILLFGES